MAISNDLNRQSNSAFIERANQMGISVLAADALWGANRLAFALNVIVKQRVHADKK